MQGMVKKFQVIFTNFNLGFEPSVFLSIFFYLFFAPIKLYKFFKDILKIKFIPKLSSLASQFIKLQSALY